MIRLNDIGDYNKRFEHGFLDDTRDLICSGQYILGPKLDEFECRVSSYLGVNHCIGVSSGTSALELVFECLDLCPEDEVVIQSNAYIACALGARRSGARLRIIDCESDATFSIAELKKILNPSIKAVLVVHLYGDSCDMEELTRICIENNIRLIEDCAQSFGSTYNGKKLGSFGYASCHSFYPTKNLGALGDGGAICTNDTAFNNRLRTYRNLGSSKKYYNTLKGTNSRLDSLQACYLLRKLNDLETAVNTKRSLAAYYTQHLRFPHLKNTGGCVGHSYHLYVITVPERNSFVEYMTNNQIETIIHYPIPFYKSEAFCEYNDLSFANAEKLAASIVSIPIHPTLSEDNVRYIVLKANNYTIQ